MKLETNDIVCAHCECLFVVECNVEPGERPSEQLIECPVPGCGKPNHRTLNGLQVNWFVVDDQIAAIRRWQANPGNHPLTCGTDSSHRLLQASVESEGQIVLLCPDCEYRQVEIPTVVLRS